ncbi:MAG: SIMPL domain-containing protein, partial [Planctomycetota bacterium]
MRTIAGKILVASAITQLSPTALWAVDQPEPRLVTVTGASEVRVVPDEVILAVGVETLNKDIKEAKAENGERVKAVIEVAGRHGVQPEHVHTDHVEIAPKYEYRQHARESRSEFVGYEVRQTISVTLRDVSKYEPLLTELLEAGVNRVHDVSFRSTGLRRHKDQARVMAIKAAHEKATALSTALGQRIGKPHSITEEPSHSWSSFGSWWRNRNWTASNVITELPSNTPADPG